MVESEKKTFRRKSKTSMMILIKIKSIWQSDSDFPISLENLLFFFEKFVPVVALKKKIIESRANPTKSFPKKMLHGTGICTYIYHTYPTSR